MTNAVQRAMHANISRPVAMRGGQIVLLIAAAFCAACILAELRRPPLLLVGNVTVDTFEVKGESRHAQGGAISFAAAVAAAYGVSACIVTAGAPDAEYSAFEGHDLHVVPSAATLTFEHSYTWWGNRRKLRVAARPNVTLSAQHVPARCRRARTVLLGPLTPDDVDCLSFIQQPGFWERLFGVRQRVGLMAQGLQRSMDGQGRVGALKQPSDVLVAALRPHVSVFLSDVETDPWPVASVIALAQRSAQWLVTRGEHGADEITASGTVTLPAEKVTAVDTNGAGDTFATAYMLALMQHKSQPGRAANWAAAQAVSQPQACKPTCVETAIRAALREGGIESDSHSFFSVSQLRASASALAGTCTSFGRQALERVRQLWDGRQSGPSSAEQSFPLWQPHVGEMQAA